MATRPRKPKVDGVSPEWANRIVDTGTVTASELMAHPKNPRIHGKKQKAAMSAVLDDIGFVIPIVVNRTTGRIVDGHMRAELAANGPIPVAWVELSEAEEETMLAVMDPIGAMADHDPDLLAGLVEGKSLGSALDEALAGLLPEPEKNDDGPDEPETVALRPMKRAHLLVSVPFDVWDQVSPILDQLDAIEGVDVISTVN